MADRLTVIDLLRHGEPVGGRRYRGQIDHPLSDAGWREMRNAVAGASPWERILSSPLIRCRAFAEHLSERLGVPLEIDRRLMEVGFGDWEGKSAEEIRTLDPTAIQRFYHDPSHHRPAGAEPLDAFVSRVAAVFDETLERYRGQHLLLVAHAGVIRAVITHVLGSRPDAMYRISVATASLTRIRDDGERPPTLVFQGRDRI